MPLEKLLAQLVARFPEQEFRLDPAPIPTLVIPARHAEFGDVQITEEDGEFVLVAGNFTHGHFACYTEGASLAEKAIHIIDDVTDFVGAMFEDHVVFWGTHQRMGGWYRIDHDGESVPRKKNGAQFVWSGPLPF